MHPVLKAPFLVTFCIGTMSLSDDPGVSSRRGAKPGHEGGDGRMHDQWTNCRMLYTDRPVRQPNFRVRPPRSGPDECDRQRKHEKKPPSVRVAR